MNVYLLLLVSACYLGTGLDFLFKGQFAWGVFWMGYAVSNCAFIVATSRAL
jgi:hypothetical protein